MTRRKLRATSAVAGVAIGVGAVVAGQQFGGAAALVVTVLVAVLALVLFVYVLLIRRLPARLRESVEVGLDPAGGPPADAVPIALDVVARWLAAVNARDWPALAALLTDDFTATGSPDGRTYGRRIYMTTARQMARMYPDLRIRVDEVLARPSEPQLAWVRLTETGAARHGPPLDVTVLERWTLDDAAGRLRAVHHAGVERMS